MKKQTLSKIEIKLTIFESEESKLTDPDEQDEEGFYKKERYIHTTLFIDGKQITADPSQKGNAFNTRISDYKEFIFRSHNFKPSYKTNNVSWFNPITCSCGEAGCAGIFDGVYSYHKKNIVKWKIKDRVVKGLIGAKYLSFDKEQYEHEVAKIWKFLEDNRSEVLYDEHYNKRTIGDFLENHPKDKRLI